MIKEEKETLFKAIIQDIAKVVKKKINENNSYDVIFLKFIRDLEKISPEEIKQAEKDICNNIKKLNEDVADDAVNYILSGKSTLGSNVKYEEILDTYNDLEKNPYKNIKELLIQWYSSSCGEIRKAYHFREWQMINGITIDDIPFIDFLIPESISDVLISDLRNIGLVERKINLNNFIQSEYIKFLSDYTYVAEKFKGWIYIRFSPISQKNVRNIIRNNSKYIYHITDVTNIDSIKKNGLLLNNRSHPEKDPSIFLLVPNRNDIINRNDVQKFTGTNIFDFENLILKALPLRLHQYRLDDGSITEQNPLKWKFCIITLDIDKIPDNIEFYWDIHSFPFAFFTKESIPANAIVDCNIERIRII